jgi:hypothetical protein
MPPVPEGGDVLSMATALYMAGSYPCNAAAAFGFRLEPAA